MTRDELLAALERLGDLLPKEAQIIIAGGAALILGGYVERATADADVVHSEPRLAQLRSAILQVAEEKGLSKDVDFEDLAEICPTDQEIAFVLSQLGRIARFRPDKALKMQLYIEQGGATTDQGDP